MQMVSIDKRIIRERFSKIAARYDDYSQIHREIGLELVSRINKLDPKPLSVLDIGTGTGFMAEKIISFYPQTKIVGVDFAFGMLKVAAERNHNINFVQADAEKLPFKNNPFDLIVSNLVFQWVDNLRELFRFTHSLLKKDGRLFFNCFTQGSLKELQNTLESVLGRSYPRQLPARDYITRCLKAESFDVESFQTYEKKELFPDAYSLAKWLKNIGANYSERIFFSKSTWSKINDFYRKNFSKNHKVVATFNVVEAGLIKK